LDPAARDDLQALRAWLQTMGATWSEARRGDVECFELTVPHARQAVMAVATPGS
jgi:hypothetical protein